jgi:2-aminoadipate transaminase
MSVVAPPPVADRMRTITSSPVRDILALTASADVISFAGGLPAPEVFDTDGIRAAFDHVLTTRPRRALQYSTTEGDPALRAAIAARSTARNLPTGPDDLLITCGSQQGLTLLAAVLLNPGDTVLVEQPSYLAALQCFSMAGARLVTVPGDGEGLDPGALADLIRRERPRLLYTIPTFQNPTGRTLPLARRRAVAEIAARAGVWIVEDDPYSELRYRGAPVPPIAVLPGAEDRTIALSTLSKIVAPGLRIGWLRAPTALLRQLVIAKQAADLHTSTVDQAAAARYLTTADVDEHVARLRAVYAPRRDAMIAALPATLPQGSTWSDPDGGMFVWARLPGRVDTAALLPTALDHGVAFVPGAPFFATDPDRATLRLSFVTNPVDTIAGGLARLGAALAAAPDGYRGGLRPMVETNS